MIITLKTVRLIKAQSEETECFSAQLVVDGKPVALVTNTGRGGANRYEPLGKTDPMRAANRDTLKRAQAWAAAKHAWAEGLDLEVGAVLARHEATKEVKRLLATGTLVQVETGELRHLRDRKGWTAEHRAQALTAYLRQRPAVRVLNGEPIDDLVTLMLAPATTAPTATAVSP